MTGTGARAALGRRRPIASRFRRAAYFGLSRRTVARGLLGGRPPDREPPAPPADYLLLSPAARSSRELSDLSARINWYLPDVRVPIVLERGASAVVASAHATLDGARVGSRARLARARSARPGPQRHAPRRATRSPHSPRQRACFAHRGTLSLLRRRLRLDLVAVVLRRNAVPLVSSGAGSPRYALQAGRTLPRSCSRPVHLLGLSISTQ